MKFEDVKQGQRVNLPGIITGVYSVGPHGIVHVQLADGRTLQTSAMNCEPVADVATDAPGADAPAPKAKKGGSK